MERLPDLNALRTFAVAVHVGSMAKAAEALGLPKSTVSRHISKMEQTVGHPLVQRAANGIEPTLEGRLLFDRISDSFSTLQALTITAERGESVTQNFQSFKPLRIRAPYVFGREFLPPFMSEAIAKFPTVRFDVTLSDRVFDVSDMAYDINFCVGIDIPFDMEAWPLGSLDAKLYASPDFSSGHNIDSPFDLKDCPLITIPCTTDTGATLRLSSKEGQKVSLNAPTIVSANDNSIILHLALAGRGICRLPEFIAAPHVRAGTLVPILPDWVMDRHKVSISAKRGYRQPVVQAFLEFAASSLSRSLGSASFG